MVGTKEGVIDCWSDADGSIVENIEGATVGWSDGIEVVNIGCLECIVDDIPI